MEASIKDLIDKKNIEGLKHALSKNPMLSNEGIPYDEENATKAHPLHRLCDGVFLKKYTDEDALMLAKIFLEYGANINGVKLTEKQDSPLIAASSLQADKVALFYIDEGANIYHAGTHGGTALHWAAWCGRDKVVERLIQQGAEINKPCVDFKATPLFWAVHGSKRDDHINLPGYLACIKILILSGADKNVPNGEGTTVFDLLNDEDTELKEQLSEQIGSGFQ